MITLFNYNNTIMKWNYLLIVFIMNILVIQISSQDCGTPIECYVKAISQISDCVKESRHQGEMFNQQIKLLENKLTDLSKKNESLTDLTAKQQELIKKLEDKTNNQNVEIKANKNLITELQNKNLSQDTLITANKNTIAELGKTVNKNDDKIKDYESRGIGKMTFTIDKSECRMRFDGFEYYGFWRKDIKFGICPNNGKCNIK